MLTRKQMELLVFIHGRLGATGVCPSFDEMKEALGLKSKSGIHRLITGLEERGFIRRLPHRARALEVVRLPDSVEHVVEDDSGLEDDAPPRLALNVIKGDFRAALAGTVAPSAEAVALPLYGRIAAGTAIEALRDNSSAVDVPAALVTGGEHYALEVAGDSMVEAGILSGDIVIIQRCDGAENGAIVVALIDDNEVTLKRLRRRGASIALEPANKNYKTQIFGPDRIKVQGRLVALIRRY